MTPSGALLFAVNLLAAMVWTGGLVAVTVATLAARATFEPTEQVRFFRALGRRYALVSGVTMVVFCGTGIALIGGPSAWTDRELTVALLTALAIALTLAGVRNARRVQALRLRRSEEGHDDRLEAAVHAATALRVAIAIATLAAVLVATT